MDINAIYFKGLIPCKKSEPELNPSEEILSLRLGNAMHRLDENSLIAIGNSSSIQFKIALENQLTKENSFIPKPRNIKDIYVIEAKNDWPVLIAKKSKKEVYLYGNAKNLTSQSKNNNYHLKSNTTAKMGDIIEFANEQKIRINKVEHESNDVLFDKVYQAHEFYKPLNNNKELKTLTKQTETIRHNTIVQRTFDDVAGIDNSVKEMKRKVLFPIIYPEAFPNTINKGTILYGEPGTGKTLLVLATIGEAKKLKDKDINLSQIDASATTKSHVGDSEEIWREIFKDAVDKQPSILFIDEIDSVLNKRAEGENHTHGNAVTTQILTLMEDLEKNDDKVWVIGATNRLDAIDPAMKRSGRFGNHIEVKRPDKQGCRDIFELYTKNLVIADMDKDAFAQELYEKKQTGADIAAMVENARDRMYEREGIYDKMEDGTFTTNDLVNLAYHKEAFVPIDKTNKKNKKVQGFITD